MRSSTPRKLVYSLAACATIGAALAACGGITEPRTATATAAAASDARAVPAADRATAAERWIALTRTILGRREFGPLGSARSYALVAVAQYDAVVAAWGAKDGRLHPSQAGAAAGAAAAVLRSLYPAEEGAVAAQLAADAAYFPSLPAERDADFAAGVAVGERVAAGVLAYAATDGSDAVWTGTIPVGPGYWRNAPPPAQPVSPLWGQVRPWVLTSGDQFRPPTPPAFGSPEFLSALAEVRQYTDNLTADQLRVAQFWQGGSGPVGPLGYFGAVATDLIAAHHMNELQATRTFAVLYMAMMDASIGCWDAKYAYWYVRPFQADPLIATPVGRPNFPSYPSAHSCFTAAAVGVLGDVFPAAADELSAAVADAGIARMYAGLHYRFDIVAGQNLGFAVARLTLEHAPRDHEVIALP